MQVQSIESVDRHELVRKTAITIKLARAFDVPIILSTVNVATGRNKETIPQLAELLEGVTSYDRIEMFRRARAARLPPHYCDFV